MLKKLLELRIWKRIYLERIGEPLIYNIASIFVALFGSYPRKIEYDLVPRQPYAFALQQAFEFAASEQARLGISEIVFIEFGVASGAGLLNICRIGEKLSAFYGIPYRVIGFDTGTGMPMPVDYRDHPEKYLDGDFLPHDDEALHKSLPDNAKIIAGPIKETVRNLASELSIGQVIGFVSIDVDYWSSTKDCLNLFDDLDITFLPKTPVYLDDVSSIDHHPYAGENLAVSEFNESHHDKKISKMNQLRNHRLFKNAIWLDQMYWFFNFKSEYYTREYHANRGRIKLSNPYLNMGLEDVTSL